MVTISRYDSVDYLGNDEAIAEYLQAALEREDDAHLRRCLAKATRARAINQLVTETGIDRQTLCDMFLETTDEATKAPDISHDVIVKVAKSFAVPVPV